MGSLNLAGRAGRWSTTHWKTAAFGWLAIAVGCVVVGSAVGAQQMKSWGVANGESRRAEQILDQANFSVPAQESVLVQSRSATVDEAAFTSAIAGVVQTLSELPNVEQITSPVNYPNAGLISRDRHSALVEFSIKGKADDAKDKIAPILAAVGTVQAGYPGVLVEEFGQASSQYELDQRFAGDMNRAELTSLPLTIGILIVAFGALVAAGLPVLLAFAAVLAATGLNNLVSHLVPTDAQTLAAVILMIGMAVGIDYSLFYLRREREERRGGLDPHQALLRTARTSGQAVLISGATVLIAMAGMFVSGNSLFDTIGIGTMIVVLAAMIGSLTVLPALLHRLGDKVDKGRIPLFRSRPSDDGRWGRFIAGGAPPPGDRGRALGRWTARARHAGHVDAHEAAEPDRPPARSEDRSNLRADPGRLPGLADTGGGRGQGAERGDTGDAARIHPLPAARARDRRALRAVHRHRQPGPHGGAHRLRDRG